MPIVGAIFGQPDFSGLKIGLGVEETLEDGTVQEAAINYGMFINTIVSFVIIGFVLFMMVKLYNRATKPEAEDAGPSEIDLLTEIRDGLNA
jgi:large conductance mechanosensitive channel